MGALSKSHEYIIIALRLIWNNSDITVRMVRQEVERMHALKKGALDAEEYKKELNKVIYKTIVSCLTPMIFEVL